MTVIALDVQAQKLQAEFADWMWVSVLIRKAGANPDDIRGHDTSTEYVEVRRALARTLRNEGWSLLRIGKAMSRNHSSVIWMLRGGRHKQCE